MPFRAASWSSSVPSSPPASVSSPTLSARKIWRTASGESMKSSQRIRRAPRPTSWRRPPDLAMSSSSCRCAASTMPSARPLRCWSAHRLPDAWLTSYPGVREHEPLRPHSWYGIGGRARYFLELADDTTLPELVARLNSEQVPYLVIGAATNTLFATDELPGLTLKASKARIA